MRKMEMLAGGGGKGWVESKGGKEAPEGVEEEK